MRVGSHDGRGRHGPELVRGPALIRGVMFVIAIMLLAACSGRSGEDDGLTGRILLWHAYDDNAAAALDDIFARFAELNPQTLVKVLHFASEEEMMAQFLDAADGGLGPDVLITSSEWVPSLVQADLLRPVDGLPDEVRARFMPDALALLEVDDRLYGLPESVNTSVLFYNKRLVEQPATTLDALLAEATSGNYVGMSADFADAFWGVGTFGGRLFADDGRIMLDRGGFANWLEWLKNVGERPGVVVDGDLAFLRSEFLAGAIAYMIADSDQFPLLSAEMGDALGVAPLPSGPVGSATPFLSADAIFVSSASSDEQARLAAALAEPSRAPLSCAAPIDRRPTSACASTHAWPPRSVLWRPRRVTPSPSPTTPSGTRFSLH
jgi:arabinogalactan oligomer/maltooligosaccharide transport system substrate-binding protein